MTNIALAILYSTDHLDLSSAADSVTSNSCWMFLKCLAWWLVVCPRVEDSIKQLLIVQIESCAYLKLFSLSSIELQCREHGSQVRSKVYTQLSSSLPCSRDALLKRVKKLFHSHIVRVFFKQWTFCYGYKHWLVWLVGQNSLTCSLFLSKEQLPHVEHPVHSLKEAIGKAMPEQLACFHQNCLMYKLVRPSGWVNFFPAQMQCIVGLNTLKMNILKD